VGAAGEARRRGCGPWRWRHDGSHESADGRTIKASECTSCHLILAQGTGGDLLDPNAKGHPFLHVDAEYDGFDCFECHTGANQEEE
jgi:hypothetical protein